MEVGASTKTMPRSATGWCNKEITCERWSKGGGLRCQPAEAERSAVDVAKVVDECFNSHLSAILGVAQMVREEQDPPLAMEQAPRGWVPEGY